MQVSKLTALVTPGALSHQENLEGRVELAVRHPQLLDWLTSCHQQMSSVFSLLIL